MPDKVIHQAAELMRDQAVAYQKLVLLTEQLTSALVCGDLHQIESLTRAGQSELLRLRSRLAQTTAILSQFAASRQSAPDRASISQEARTEFESASDEVLRQARLFQRSRGRAAALAMNGVAYAGACIEMCGVKPTTYGAPYVRPGGGKWL
ncbi:MAG TPA: hypothetical protein VLZ81_10270 [Blastocatellia bacterium]|nr:hypothetical protein [Blastocatellia bacterium]